MDVQSEFTRLRLASDESIIINDAAGTELVVCRGTVWVTQYGDSRDIILKTGQSFTLELPQGALMSGTCGDAEVVLRAAPSGRRQAASRGWVARLLGLFDPRWRSRVQQSLVGRRRIEYLA